LWRARVTAATEGLDAAVSVLDESADGVDKRALLGAKVELLVGAARIGDAKKSLAALGKLRRAGKSPWTGYSRALVAQALGKRRAAKTDLKASAKADPQFAPALLKLVELDKKAGPAALAKAYSRTQSPVVAVALGHAHSASGDDELALSRLAEHLWAEPSLWGSKVGPTAMALAYIDALSQVDTQRALELGARRAVTVPDELPLMLLLVDVAKRHGDPSETIKWYVAVDRLQPFDLRVVSALSEVYLSVGEHLLARQALDGLLKEKPASRTPWLLYLLARTWMPDDDARARSYLFESIRKTPSTDAYVLLGELESRRADRDNALEAYREAIKLDPGRVDIRTRIVELLVRGGLLRGAVKQLRFVVTKQPANAAAREKLGDVLHELGKPKKAVEQYTRALRDGADNHRLLLKTARLQLYELDDLPRAVRNLERALELDGEDPKAHYLLAYAQKDMQEFEQALVHFRRYVELAPDGEYAAEVKEEILSLE